MIGTGRAPSVETEKVNVIRDILDESPNGAPPLCKHIQQVIAEITAIADELRAMRKFACVVIITDGEASDGNISDAMKPLIDLPVWLVIRLSTDSETVVNYWNSIDQVLELQIDVIDDFKSEATQIQQFNPWLTYGEELHRAREFGLHFKELDLLDEGKLSSEQMMNLCKVLFGKKEFVHPEIDWDGFLAMIQQECQQLRKVWSPMEVAPKEWIDLKLLQRQYRPVQASSSGCCHIS